MSSSIPDTRTRILQATCTLLEDSPQKTTRMADIAKAAGISRQAVYLHFSNRAELLIATTRFVDQTTDLATRLNPSRVADTGVERLEEFILAWGSHIPEIHPVAQALMAMKDSDAAANEAWSNRMQAMREGCAAAVQALVRDQVLMPEHSDAEATDILWTLLSVHNWELLTQECGWTQAQYVAKTIAMARRMLVCT
ncbi:MAG: TetR/AcrR family transcriptional regulator [Rhodobacteraceae bacterium]|nr:TetR/AcrR family transcriptional regulator [Paracoccaceae bacterium]